MAFVQGLADIARHFIDMLGVRSSLELNGTLSRGGQHPQDLADTPRHFIYTHCEPSSLGLIGIL
jgi:hypothetical protein